MKKLNRKGFTLVEIMIVVAIIGLLAAIAIPNFVTARATAQENACRSSIRTMQGALELWAFENDSDPTGGGAGMTNVALQAALAPTYIRTFPSCPSGAAADYTVDGTGVVICANHP